MGGGGVLNLDSDALKRMLQPVGNMESPPASPLTSPESTRRNVSVDLNRSMSGINDGFQSEPETGRYALSPSLLFLRNTQE